MRRYFGRYFPPRCVLTILLLGLVVVGTGMQRRTTYPGQQPARRQPAVQRNTAATPAENKTSEEQPTTSPVSPPPAPTVAPGKKTGSAASTSLPASSARRATHPTNAQAIAPPGNAPGAEASPIPPLIRRSDSIVFPPPRNDEPRNIPKTISLCGDRNKPEPYTIRIKVPVGAVPTPHVHPDTRMSVVISGSYYFGYGNVISPETATLLGPGSFFTEPAGVPHFGWAKDGEVVIQSSGFGPTKTRVVPQYTARDE